MMIFYTSFSCIYKSPWTHSYHIINYMLISSTVSANDFAKEEGAMFGFKPIMLLQAASLMRRLHN